MILCLPALRPTPQNQPTLLTKCPAPIIIPYPGWSTCKREESAKNTGTRSSHS